MPKVPFILFAAAVAVFSVVACNKPANHAPTGGGGARPVLTTRVVTHDEPLYLEEIGSCAATESVSVQAQVTGKIIERHFADGANVKKGQLLFTIDPRPYQAALDQAKGALDTNKAKLKLDQINLERAQNLQNKKVISPQDFDTARTNVASDQATVEAGEAAVAAAQVNLDYCTIESPIDGRAGERQVDAGNIVTANSGGAVLVTVQKLDPIYTNFTVAQSDLAEVRKYLPKGNIKVETSMPDDPSPPRQGNLYFLDTMVQPGAGTVKAVGITPNPDHLLLPGAFVHVRLILDTLKDAALIPNQAVQISQAGPYVFVVKADGTLEQRPVTPGQRQGDQVVITQGLKAGETVVTSGQIALAQGMKVKAQPDPAFNKAAAETGSH